MIITHEWDYVRLPPVVFFANCFSPFHPWKLVVKHERIFLSVK